MKYYVDNIVAPIHASERDVRSILAAQLGVAESSFRFQIVKRRSVLVNNKLCLRYDAVVDTFEFVRNTTLHFFEGHSELKLPKSKSNSSPVIVGAGFTGLFAAYLLMKSGARPIVLEQGEEIASRRNTCSFLEGRGQIPSSSNNRNGEGGSGAMLGGVVEQLPHIAENDYLLRIFQEIGLCNYPEIEDFRFSSAEEVSRACSFMKRYILENGGSFVFNARILGVERFLGWPKAVTYLQNGSKKTLRTKAILMATGTSVYSLYASEMCRFMMEPSKPKLAVFIETNGRDFENEYYGRGRTGQYPPLFLREEIPNRFGREITLEFAYPNATLINVATESNLIDLGISEGLWSGNGNAISCLSISLTKEEAESISREGTPAFAGRLLGECCKKENPHAAPAETLGDFLSKKEPLLFGDVRSSYRGGVYLMNLHRLLPPALDQAFTHGLYQAGRKYPLLARSGSILIGFSTLGTAKNLPPHDFLGSKGLYSALPEKPEERNLMDSAHRALQAVKTLLEDE